MPDCPDCSHSLDAEENNRTFDYRCPNCGGLYSESVVSDVTDENGDSRYSVEIGGLAEMDVGLLLQGLAHASREAALHGNAAAANRANVLQHAIVHNAPLAFHEISSDIPATISNVDTDDPHDAFGLRGGDHYESSREAMSDLGLDVPPVPEEVHERFSEASIEIDGNDEVET